MRRIVLACFILMAALGAAGLVTWTPIRHLIQTTPIWFGIGLSAVENQAGKWAALGLFSFWLAMQLAIWAALAGLLLGSETRFSPVEVVLSVGIAAAALHGIVLCSKTKTETPWVQAIGVFAVSALMQFAAFLVSVLPSVVNR